MASVGKNVWFVICTEHHEDGDPKQYMCVRGDKEVNENKTEVVRYVTNNGQQCKPIEDEGTAVSLEYSRWLRPKYHHPCYHYPMQFISDEEEELFDEFWHEEIN